jgi:hypothetical protein
VKWGHLLLPEDYFFDFLFLKLWSP